MFENITDITLEGGLFTTPTTLHNILERPMNIVLGVNGSGKTTISRHFIDNNHEQYNDKVHIFNDDYIQQNLSLQEANGLKTIVMLGEQHIAQQNNKDTLIARLKQIDLRLEQLPGLKEQAQSELQQAKESLVSALNDRNGGYAVRQVHSYGLKNMTAKHKVSPESADMILKSAKQYCELAPNSDDKKKLDDLIASLAPIGDKEGKPIDFQLPVDYLTSALVTVNTLLQRTIPQPTLTERDDFIIRIATNAVDAHYINEAQSIFVQHRGHRCPLCMQTLTDEYIKQLESHISAILNKESEMFVQQIDACLLSLQPPISNWSSISRYCPKEVEALDTAHEQLASALEQVINLLNAKKTNLYNAGNPLPTSLTSVLEQYHSACRSLETAVSKYNTDLQNATKLRDHFSMLNIKASYFENQALFNRCYTAEQTLAQLTMEDSTLTQEQNEKLYALKALDNSKQDLSIAMNFINKCLSFVFFDDMHLMLKEENDYYSVKVRNADVKPNKLSLGEKNVIALAYFFAELFTGQHESDKYNNEMLVVIDDPISSFDEINRMGMLTMLGDQIKEILLGNSKSKVLVMTHDMRTAEDLAGVWKRQNEIHCQRDIRYNDKDYAYLKLTDKSLVPVANGTFSDYALLLQDICNYALSDSEDQINESESVSIGNKIRRVLETYNTFNYRQGVEKAFNNSYFTGKLSDRAKLFYQRLPLSLMLNRESHRATSELDTLYSYSDKKRLARAVLLYLYIVGHSHLKQYLKKEQYPMLEELFGYNYAINSNAIFDE